MYISLVPSKRIDFLRGCGNYFSQIIAKFYADFRRISAELCGFICETQREKHNDLLKRSYVISRN